MNERTRQIVELLGGKAHLAEVGKGRLQEMTLALCEAIVLTEQLRTDQEMADLLQVHVRTLRRWLEADPGAISCAVLDPTPPKRGQVPTRRWMAWELLRRWRGRAERKGATS